MYPPTFYNDIIRQTIEKLVTKSRTEDKPSDQGQGTQTDKTKKHKLFIQYRGRVTDDYVRSLRRIDAPCAVVLTMRKLITVFPSLKPSVEKMQRSGVVYKLKCSLCNKCYVGMTERRLQDRFKEHIQKKGPMKEHLRKCRNKLTEDDVEILISSARSEGHLLTLEALFIKELKPRINTKEEWKSRTLAIVFGYSQVSDL